ncbi:RluA family pseudouridine synthase [Desulfosporosinus sp. OT]|uniref:RluA family pseudouridine synthase n=1 Tax=Desulfosporosinus sp. OT TaxID=913865 RepID=UPI000223A94E|nr:RluA family pseudouridine synthase [Desulfosporosinus sp. OT]EGW38303.1 pseudouridine synthase, RluA family protein [Desulfosporosinus sp. OT]
MRVEKEIHESALEDFEFEEQVSEEENSLVGPNIAAKKETFELAEGIRLDVGVTDVLGKSRSFVQGLIAQECVRVNGSPKKANYKVRQGDQIEVEFPILRESTAEPENIPLDILYEDEDVLVVNKRQGMVVHPAPGAWTGTMVNALLFHCRNLSGINGVLRPGIVHRIDKDTSGILVVAKNDIAHQGLAVQLKEHSMARKYLALVHGVVLEPSGTVDAPIGRDPSERKRMAVVMHHSKPAVTHYTVLERFSEATYLEVRLETGRTHQIRVHMAYLKHPVLGDPIYGPKRNKYGLPGQMLHAVHLGFEHPRSGIWMEFDAPVPKTFAMLVEKLHSS